MKKKWILALLVCCIIFVPHTALADDPIEQAIADQIEQDIADNISHALTSADLHEIESYYNAYAQTLEPVTGGAGFRSFLEMLAMGGANFDISGVFSLVISSMFTGIEQSIPAIIQIIVVALVFSIITHFAPSFGATGVSNAAQTAQYVIVGTMTIGIFVSAFAIGTEAISRMTAFTADFFPLLITLLTALGGISSAAILSPATVFLTTGVSLFYKNIVMPMIIVLTVFTIINHFSTSVKLNGFCGILKSLIKWGIGISSTVFAGIIAIQGLLGSTFDGLSIKTAKYTIDKFIPIVGGMFSDSADVLISCTLLIKNAVGIAGIIIIIGAVISPLFALLAHHFLFKLAGAVLEPIAGGSMSKFARDAAGVLLLLFAAVAAAAIMFFVTTAVIIGAGSANVMLR